MNGSYGDVLLAVAGAHLTGQPLNFQLVDRGAELVEPTTTAPVYRLFALDTAPPKPGVVRVADGGKALDVEVWRMTAAAFGDFVAHLPQPMAIGRVELADGRQVCGFLVEPIALDSARDITVHRGWREYLRQSAGAGDTVQRRRKQLGELFLMSGVCAALALLFVLIWALQSPQQDFWPAWTALGLAVGPAVVALNALARRRPMSRRGAARPQHHWSSTP